MHYLPLRSPGRISRRRRISRRVRSRYSRISARPGNRSKLLLDPLVVRARAPLGGHAAARPAAPRDAFATDAGMVAAVAARASPIVHLRATEPRLTNGASSMKGGRAEVLLLLAPGDALCAPARLPRTQGTGLESAIHRELPKQTPDPSFQTTFISTLGLQEPPDQAQNTETEAQHNFTISQLKSQIPIKMYTYPRPTRAPLHGAELRARKY
jgi:hypothetical protein